MVSGTKHKIKINGIEVYTNLIVKMKARTTREEAGKEVDRIIEEEDIFKDYDWKIDDCPEGGTLETSPRLQEDIKSVLQEEDPEDTVFWDGMTASYELNVYNVKVKTNIETQLKSSSKEDAVKEIEGLLTANDIFEGYDWKISDCSEGGINDPGMDLQTAIISHVQSAGIEDCIVTES